METKEKSCCRQTKRDEEDKRQIIIRLNKIIGQMNGVKKMIEMIDIVLMYYLNYLL